MVHICLIHPLKAQIFVYLRIYGRKYPDLRIDNCDERAYYKDSDISGLKGAIFINDISIESPDFSLLHDII